MSFIEFENIYNCILIKIQAVNILRRGRFTVKKALMVLCMVAIPVSMASALPDRGFVGGQNEVEDSDFTMAQSIYSGSGNPADAGWSINPSNPYSFVAMMSGATGYAFDHGQQADDFNQMITAVNAVDGNLYNPTGTSQMIDLSFFAHIDDGGYIIVGVHWWDSINPALLQNPVNPMALPEPNHEIILYHEEPYFSSDFVVTTPDQDNEMVADSLENMYDLYQFQTTIAQNPQYMIITVTIGHEEDSGPLPESAFFTDLQFQQMSLGGVVVPEPATMILLGMSLIAGFVRKLRK